MNPLQRKHEKELLTGKQERRPGKKKKQPMAATPEEYMKKISPKKSWDWIPIDQAPWKIEYDKEYLFLFENGFIQLEMLGHDIDLILWLAVMKTDLTGPITHFIEPVYPEREKS